MPNCLVPSAQDKSEGPASPRARLRLCPRLPIVLCLQHIIHAEGMKLCRPYRAESFTRGLIPGAAPDGLPQAIELSCAFSADLVSRRLTGNAGILARPMLVRQARAIEGGLCSSPRSTSVSFFDQGWNTANNAKICPAASRYEPQCAASALQSKSLGRAKGDVPGNRR